MTATEIDIKSLEKELGYHFPKWYFSALLEPWFTESHVEICFDLNELQKDNISIRKLGAWECKWENCFWAIGGDGVGGIYFISLLPDKHYGLVYYIDHENPPTDIDDEGVISKYTPDEFREMINESDANFHADCLKSMEKIKNRKWHQFWIPRVPPEWLKIECAKKVKSQPINSREHATND